MEGVGEAEEGAPLLASSRKYPSSPTASDNSGRLSVRSTDSSGSSRYSCIGCGCTHALVTLLVAFVLNMVLGIAQLIFAVHMASNVLVAGAMTMFVEAFTFALNMLAEVLAANAPGGHKSRLAEQYRIAGAVASLVSLSCVTGVMIYDAVLEYEMDKPSLFDSMELVVFTMVGLVVDFASLFFFFVKSDTDETDEEGGRVPHRRSAGCCHFHCCGANVNPRCTSQNLSKDTNMQAAFLRCVIDLLRGIASIAAAMIIVIHPHLRQRSGAESKFSKVGRIDAEGTFVIAGLTFIGMIIMLYVVIKSCRELGAKDKKKGWEAAHSTD